MIEDDADMSRGYWLRMHLPAGFLLFLLAVALSLTGQNLARSSDHNGLLTAEKNSQTRFLVIRDTGRAILVSENNDIPPTGWDDPGGAFFNLAAQPAFPLAKTTRTGEKEGTSAALSSSSGFLARAPPVFASRTSRVQSSQTL